MFSGSYILQTVEMRVFVLPVETFFCFYASTSLHCCGRFATGSSCLGCCVVPGTQYEYFSSLVFFSKSFVFGFRSRLLCTAVRNPKPLKIIFEWVCCVTILAFRLVLFFSSVQSSVFRRDYILNHSILPGTLEQFPSL